MTDVGVREPVVVGDDGRGEDHRGPHLVAVWVAGYLTVAVAVVLNELVDERAVPAPLAVVVFLLLGWVLLAVADRVAPASRAGRGWRRRLGWASAVSLLAALWLVAEAPLVHTLQGSAALLRLGAVLWVALVFAALPYPVLAGVLAAGRSWWWPTWLVLLAVVTVLALRVAWVSDTRARVGRQLEAVGVTINDVYLADVPGYRLSGWREPPYAGAPAGAPVGLFQYVPTSGHGPAIVVFSDDRAIDHQLCGPDPVLVSVDGAVTSGAVSCAQDGDGLWYRRAPNAQQYVHTFSNATVRVSSTGAAPRDVLRRAARSARQASYSEIERLLPDGGLYRPVDQHSWMFFF